MKSIVFSLLLIASCGNNTFLEPGTYKVDSFFVQDDFFEQGGEESFAIWNIKESNGEYTITVFDDTVKSFGNVDNSTLTMSNEYSSTCGGVIYASSIIQNEYSNTEFNGTATLVIDICYGDVSFVEAELYGKRIKE